MPLVWGAAMLSKEIKRRCDYEKDWTKLIPALRHYDPESTEILSILGDAPKDFVKDSEYRPGYRSRSQRSEAYVAKVGSKWYPMESITEQLLTDIGELFGANIAQSKLRIIDGQVRFMSKYFLQRRTEVLTHGAEIFAAFFGKEDYAQLARDKTERTVLTFQMASEAIESAFPNVHEAIMRGFVEMLAFDALIGHTERHPYNWGVIVPVRQGKAPRFSPLFDTARALFWNIDEARTQRMLRDKGEFEAYVRRCKPPIGWDYEDDIDFFSLISLIWEDGRYTKSVERFLDPGPLEKAARTLNNGYNDLMSPDRRELILTCLRYRQEALRKACS